MVRFISVLFDMKLEICDEIKYLENEHLVKAALSHWIVKFLRFEFPRGEEYLKFFREKKHEDGFVKVSVSHKVSDYTRMESFNISARIIKPKFIVASKENGWNKHWDYKDPEIIEYISPDIWNYLEDLTKEIEVLKGNEELFKIKLGMIRFICDSAMSHAIEDEVLGYKA